MTAASDDSRLDTANVRAHSDARRGRGGGGEAHDWLAPSRAHRTRENARQLFDKWIDQSMDRSIDGTMNRSINGWINR